MPTANERKALWFLALVALSGSSVRLCRAGASQPTVTERIALERQIQRVDSVRSSSRTRAGRSKSAGRPAGARDAPLQQPIDIDQAAASDLEKLPGIGPALARRIVADREASGPFGSLDALCGVRGIGPATIERLRPLVTFSGLPRRVSGACGSASRAGGSSRRAGGRQSP